MISQHQLPETMAAMVTMGHGGLDQMVWHENWPCPRPSAGQVMIRVGACGLNNTDVNTRSGWYSKAVSDATKSEGYDQVSEEDPTWGGAPIQFPRIQGADVCGLIVAVGDGVDPQRIGNGSSPMAGCAILMTPWIRIKPDILDQNVMAVLLNIPLPFRKMRWQFSLICLMRNWRPFRVPIQLLKEC